ncbi:MAG: NERD domain-containing protein [Clostridia bacterium]|nr:NERD domain-containing protein [Clostridia bacterium]
MIYLILLVIIISAISLYLSSSSFKGKYGEKRVRRKLGKTILGKKYVFNDVYFKDNTKSIQIDHILVSEKGIIVLETKNYSGRVYGNETQQEWTQVLAYGKRKNKFYNPVKQNASHCYYLNKIIGEKVPIISLIVFTQNNNQYIDSDKVVGISSLKKKLQLMPDIIDSKQIINISNKINLHIVTTPSNKEHVKSIITMKEHIDNNICPRCGGNLILRNGKYGEFYGCDEYPKCKFIKSKK